MDRSEPKYTVYRHRDGMLVCWTYDAMDKADRYVTNTTNVNELANYLPDVEAIAI